MLLGLVVLGLGCATEEADFVQLNQAGEYLLIDVGTQESGEARSIELLDAETGDLLGTALVDPGEGPLGTEHTVLVTIDEAYRNVVDRVTVRSFSGARGVDEYELDSQQAGEEVYQTTLISVGDDGESRVDLLTIRAWDEIDAEVGDEEDSDD